MFNEVDARSSDRIDKTSGAREGHPLDRAAGGALTPRGATVLRERSYRELVARQAVHDKKIAGNFVLISPWR